MPAGKQSQSSAMLYTLIAFVTISIIATVCAVYFYVKAEDYKTQRVAKEDALAKFANPSEQSQLARIVGKAAQGKTVLGTMNDLLNERLFDVIAAIGQGKEPTDEAPVPVAEEEATPAEAAESVDDDDETETEAEEQ